MTKGTGSDAAYFVSSNPIMVNDWAKRHARFPHSILNMVWINDVDLQLEKMPMSNRWLMKTGYTALKMINRVVSSEVPFQDDLVSIQRVEEFDDSIEPFWGKVSEFYHFIFVRDKEYLNWRFCDPRGGEFTILMA